MRSNIPVVAPVIDETATAIAVELVFHGETEFGTCVQGLIENVITIWRVVVQSDGARSPLAMGFREFEDGVANLEFRVADDAWLERVFRKNLCAKSGLHEGEKASGVFHTEAGVEVLEKSGTIAGASGVRGDEPVIADGICDASFAVAVFHLLGRVDGFGAGLGGGIVGGVDVADVVVESGEERFMFGAANVAHFQHGVAEFDGGVRDAVVGILRASGFLGVKGGLQEVEKTRDATNDEIRSDVAVALGHGRERFGHGLVPFLLASEIRNGPIMAPVAQWVL